MEVNFAVDLIIALAVMALINNYHKYMAKLVTSPSMGIDKIIFAVILQAPLLAFAFFLSTNQLVLMGILSLFTLPEINFLRRPAERVA